MTHLPPNHVWLCQPCGASVNKIYRESVTSFVCEHTTHPTAEGYCCACGYDIAGFEQDKKNAALSAVQECVRAVEKQRSRPSSVFAPAEQMEGYDLGCEEVLEALKSIEARMREGTPAV